MLKLLTKTTIAMMLTGHIALSYAGDLSVSRSIVVNASPETTWKMIGDFNHLDVWHPVVVASDLTQGSQNQIGAIRLLTLADKSTITEKLVNYDTSDKTYSYRITQSQLPVQDYVGTITVSAANEGKAKITWSSTFDAKPGVADSDAVNGTAGIYEAGLTNINNHFK